MIVNQGTVIIKILDPILGEVVRFWEGTSDFFKDIKKSWCDIDDVILCPISLFVLCDDVIDLGCDAMTSMRHLLNWILAGEKARKCASLRFFVRLWGSQRLIVIFKSEVVRLFPGINIF